MCFNGVTYCIKRRHIQKRLDCGYTLGGCNEQQTAACNNVPVATTAPSCACSAPIETLTLRYIGPYNQTVEANAKKNCILINTFNSTNTGDLITIDAADAGLLYLRKDTYLSLPGLSSTTIKIPTNCCNISVGQTFFPFEVVSWTDTDGNDCNNSSSSARMNANPITEIEYEDGNTATIAQFPNPASSVSTFEFSVPEDDEVVFSIVDIRGQIIQNIFSGYADAAIVNSFTTDVSKLISGIYFIHLKTSEGVFKKKFIIIK